MLDLVDLGVDNEVTNGRDRRDRSVHRFYVRPAGVRDNCFTLGSAAGCVAMPLFVGRCGAVWCSVARAAGERQGTAGRARAVLPI